MHVTSTFRTPVPTCRVLAVLTLTTVFLASPAVAQWRDLLEGLGRRSKGDMSDAKIGSGLKEALQVGTENAVNLTGRTGGYFRNEAIKILMPEKLKTVEKGLRLAGYGSEVDEFVLSMNRSAEKAAPFAKQIFITSIQRMTFEDARRILSGGETAATDYFRDKTSDQLAAAFRPVVEKSMNEVGVSRQYKSLIGRYEDFPFAKSVLFDVDQYVVDQALKGLFHVLAEEERKIRTDPAARVTTLLREVFQDR